MLAALLLSVAPLAVPAPQAFTSASFSSEDGLRVSAELYKPDTSRNRPCIVLFHQAGWSAGEYRKIAPRLNALGYSCFAVDLRSGGSINGKSNGTMAAAVEAGKPFRYVDALPDVRAALRFARERYVEEGQPVIALGSSYSASLCLVAVGEESGLADGVMAFSPGEYFTDQGKPADWVATAAAELDCPTFITSAKDEHEDWKPIFDAIPARTKTSYLPAEQGRHGASALWPQFKFSPGYWEAVEGFLATNFPTRRPDEPKQPRSDG